MASYGGTYILGKGGHARSLRGVLHSCGHSNVSLCDYEKEDELPGDVSVILGIGNTPRVGDSDLHKREMYYTKFLWRMRGLISPGAHIARNFDGLQALPGSVINAGAEMGANCIVNTGAVVEHDCKVGRSCHIAPGAVLCGGVTVGNYTHIGAGAVVNPNIRVGSNCVVGAGAVVIRDVDDGATVVGNPAHAI